MRINIANSDKATGQLQHAGRQKQGWNPLLPDAKDRFPEKKSILGKPLTFGSARLGHIPSLPWESQLPLKPCLTLQSFDFKGNCNSSDSLLDFCFISLYSFICFANVGYSPTPRQHFCKTAAPKNFSVACGSYLSSHPSKFDCSCLFP